MGETIWKFIKKQGEQKRDQYKRKRDQYNVFSTDNVSAGKFVQNLGGK